MNNIKVTPNGTVYNCVNASGLYAFDCACAENDYNCETK